MRILKYPNKAVKQMKSVFLIGVWKFFCGNQLAWYAHLLSPSALLNNRNYIFYTLYAGIFNLYKINSFSKTDFQWLPLNTYHIKS